MTMSNFNDTQNKQIVTTAIDDLKLNPVTDAIPRQVLPTIQPVFELKRIRCNVYKGGSAINATSGAIYTTPSDKDFYLCGVQLSTIKDATSTSVNEYVQATDADGNTIYPALIISLSLTVQNGNISNSYSAPVKLKRNSAITVNNGTATGNVSSYGIIWGYTEDAGPQYV